MKYVPYIIVMMLAGCAAYLYWQRKKYTLTVPLDEVTVRRAGVKVV